MPQPASSVSGAEVVLSQFVAGAPVKPDLVVGANHTAYFGGLRDTITGLRSLVAFDMDTGAVKFQQTGPAPGIWFSPVYAGADKLLAAEESYDGATSAFINRKLFTLDPAGNKNYISDGTAAMFAFDPTIGFYLEAGSIRGKKAVKVPAPGTNTNEKSGGGTNAAQRTIKLRVYKVFEAQISDSQIASRVNSGIQYWKENGILLQWDGQIMNESACPASKPGCAVDGDLQSIFNCSNVACQREVYRRFPSQKGIDLVFVFIISGSFDGGTIQGTVVGAPTTFTNKMVLIKNGRDVIPHELGHAFQLPHYGSSEADNLMCGPKGSYWYTALNWLDGLFGSVVCSSSTARQLTPDQKQKAKSFSVLWESAN